MEKAIVVFQRKEKKRKDKVKLLARNNRIMCGNDLIYSTTETNVSREPSCPQDTTTNENKVIA